ncbi:MAG: alpha/beta fold hydrolase [Pseudobacteriovorax sp.]|nr:alpha/beta fold hydrolase [Pseudobacteriovorax sp.]
MNPDHVLVFLHGFLGDTRDWQRVIQVLLDSDPKILCISIDLPGHGGSKHYQPETWKVLCEDIMSEIKARAVSVDGLIGYSMGGRIATLLAVLFPESFRLLVLESSSFGIADASERRRRLDWELSLNLSHVTTESSKREFLQQWYRLSLFIGIEKTEGFQAMMERRMDQDFAAIEQGMRSTSVAFMPCLDHFLQKTDQNILYIYGELDQKYADIATSLGTAANVIGAADASHNVHLTNPSWFAGILAQNMG